LRFDRSLYHGVLPLGEWRRVQVDQQYSINECPRVSCGRAYSWAGAEDRIRSVADFSDPCRYIRSPKPPPADQRRPRPLITIASSPMFCTQQMRQKTVQEITAGRLGRDFNAAIISLLCCPPSIPTWIPRSAVPAHCSVCCVWFLCTARCWPTTEQTTRIPHGPTRPQKQGKGSES